MHQNLGRDLASKRQQSGLRLEDVAATSGLSVPTVRLVENNGGTINSLIKLATALNQRLTWAGLAPTHLHGKSLADRRKRMGISQRNMAERIDVSQRTIIGIENHFRGRVESIERYLDAIKLRPVFADVDAGSPNDASADWQDQLASLWSASDNPSPTSTLICGDALDVLRTIPSGSIDCVLTSPPYWLQRTYSDGGIGAEPSVEPYVSALRLIFKQVHRVLKPDGSVWLNIDDTYFKKSMQGIPWRVVLGMVEDSGWYIRNDVIWSKTGGSLNRSQDRLGHAHEHMFHLTKSEHYFYDADAIRQPAKPAVVLDDEVKTATGVSKATCIQRIKNASALTKANKTQALLAVEETFAEIAMGDLHDFRLILRGENRVIHSDDPTNSKRSDMLREQGFYFLRYDPRGTLPKDVWTLSPDRSRGRTNHYAAFPEELCEIPIKATCTGGGIVLDPFVGTGTTILAAQNLGRRGIGIDLSQDYLDIAQSRLSANNVKHGN